MRSGREGLLLAATGLNKATSALTADVAAQLRSVLRLGGSAIPTLTHQ
jgi:hypothetical protein